MYRNFLYIPYRRHDRMNTKILTSNSKMLAMILGVAVIATVGASFAYAQTAGTTQGQNTQDNSTPQIQGSVNLQQMLLSSVKTQFSDAANTAAAAVTKGQVIGGSLNVVQGSVVYNFKVIDGINIYSVIVDAGNGQVLYTSQGHPLHLGALLGMGHDGMMYKHHMHNFGQQGQQQSPTAPTNPPTGTQ